MNKVNEFEQSILFEIAKEHDQLKSVINTLVVTKRELTGAGSYTDFAPIDTPVKGDLQILDLSKIINIPGIEHGLGAHIQMSKGVPEFLEIYTYGESNWDGSYDNFSYEK